MMRNIYQIQINQKKKQTNNSFNQNLQLIQCKFILPIIKNSLGLGEKKKSIKFYLKSNGKNSSNFTTSPMSPAAKLIFKPKESKTKTKKQKNYKQIKFHLKNQEKKNKELISLKIPTKIKQMLDRGRKDLTLLSLWRELQQTHIELTL